MPTRISTRRSSTCSAAPRPEPTCIQAASVAADLCGGTEARVSDWTVEREQLARALSDPLDGDQGSSSSPKRNGAPTVDARYRALVRNLPDTVVAVHDRDLCGVSIDGPIVSQVGFDPARLVGVPLERTLGSDDFQRIAPAYHAALAGETVTAEFEYTPSGAVYSSRSCRCATRRAVRSTASSR